MAHLEQTSFNFVRYANVWEDPVVLLKAMDLKPQSRILSIASAGDNCFSLLTTDPELIVAADLNPAQFHLISLKKAAILQLERAELLAFLGFTTSNQREKVYQLVRSSLPPEAATFWDARPEDIAMGVVHSGKFERYFQTFAGSVLPFIHRRRTVEALLSAKSREAQEQFYTEKWNTWRWRMLFRVFFSEWVMGKLGRDPAFFKHVDTPVSEQILNRAEQHLRTTHAHHNTILRYNLTGSFGALLPHYLQPEVLPLVKARLDRIQFFQGYIQDAGAIFGSFDGMNLSDIFEYMDTDTCRLVGKSLLASTNPGCTLCYWNLLAPRSLAALFPEQLRAQKLLADSLKQADIGFFYGDFHADKTKI